MLYRQVRAAARSGAGDRRHGESVRPSLAVTGVSTWPAGFGPGSMLALQRTYGNQAVQRMIAQRQAPPVVRPGGSGAQAIPAIQRSVGFEFQMLKSKVKLYQGTKLLEPGESLDWSGNSTWHIEYDGTDKDPVNIEFVLEPVDDPETAESRVNEVHEVAKNVADPGSYKKDKQAEIENTMSIVVEEPDTQGQPQVNVDISPRYLVEGSLGFRIIRGKNEKIENENRKYFGVEYDPHHWKYSDTKVRLIIISKIQAAMRKISSEEVIRSLQEEFDAVEISKESVGEEVLQKAEMLVRAYCIVETIITDTVARGLSKDIPLLPKLNLTSLERAIPALLKVGLEEHGGLVGNDADALVLTRKFPRIIEQLQSASGVHKRALPNWDTTEDKRFLTGVRNPKDVSPEQNYSILFEYRRVPLKAVSEWPAFAKQAAIDFADFDT